MPYTAGSAAAIASSRAQAIVVWDSSVLNAATGGAKLCSLGRSMARIRIIQCFDCAATFTTAVYVRHRHVSGSTAFAQEDGNGTCRSAIPRRISRPRRPKADQVPRLDRRLLGGAVLAPQGLHAGLHHRARLHGAGSSRSSTSAASRSSACRSIRSTTTPSGRTTSRRRRASRRTIR